MILIAIDSAITFGEVKKIKQNGKTAYQIDGFNPMYKYAGLVEQENGVDYVIAVDEDGHGKILISAMIGEEVYKSEDVMELLKKAKTQEEDEQ